MPASSDADRKLEELIVYIATKCEGDHSFGATKLNKILFFADFSSFAKRGASVSGQEYMRLPQGPVPRRLVPARERLLSDGTCVSATRTTLGGYEQQRLIATREADLSAFSGEEVATVDWIIDRVRGMNGTQISDLSHAFDGWKLADEKETIPYETVFLSSRPLSASELAEAEEIARSRV